MATLVTSLGRSLTEVHITDLEEGVFYSNLVFDDGTTVSARPSDAIALALRTGTTIFATEELLDTAAILIPDEEEDEDEVEKFREFLDQISPEDFQAEGPQS